MLIDLNNSFCQNEENNMFDRDIHDYHAARIVNAKYKQVDMNKVAADQNLLIPIHANNFNMS